MIHRLRLKAYTNLFMILIWSSFLSRYTRTNEFNVRLWIKIVSESFRVFDSSEWESNLWDLLNHWKFWMSSAESSSNRFQKFSWWWLHAFDEVNRDIIQSFLLNDAFRSRQCWHWYSFQIIKIETKTIQIINAQQEQNVDKYEVKDDTSMTMFNWIESIEKILSMSNLNDFTFFLLNSILIIRYKIVNDLMFFDDRSVASWSINMFLISRSSYLDCEDDVDTWFRDNESNDIIFRDESVQALWFSILTTVFESFSESTKIEKHYDSQFSFTKISVEISSNAMSMINCDDTVCRWKIDLSQRRFWCFLENTYILTWWLIHSWWYRCRENWLKQRNSLLSYAVRRLMLNDICMLEWDFFTASMIHETLNQCFIEEYSCFHTIFEDIRRMKDLNLQKWYQKYAWNFICSKYDAIIHVLRSTSSCCCRIDWKCFRTCE